MSTKIYRAYRLKRTQDLWPLVHDIKVKGTKNVKKVLTDLLLEMTEAVDPLSEEYGVSEVAHKHLGYDQEVLDRRVRLEVASNFLTKRYREASTSHLRDPMCFDVAVGFRHYKGRIYLIPYCDMLVGRTLDFLDLDSRLELEQLTRSVLMCHH